MTEEEKELIKILGNSFNEFIRLPILHPADRGEFAQHIHALQNMVAMRQSQRENPELFWSAK